MLKISGIPSARTTIRQREFFDPKRMSYGLCRYYAGDFCEEATAALTSATRLKTDSRRVTCPDLQFSPRQFLESKSVGLTNESILYQVRLQRDADFRALGNEIFYTFWHHNFRVTSADCKYDLHSKLAGHLLEVIIVPFSVIWETYRNLPAKLLNKGIAGQKSGYGVSHDTSNTYGMGWNVPLAPLAAQCTIHSTIAEIQVYDATITNLRVRCHPSVLVAAPGLIAIPSIEYKASVMLEELLANRLEVQKWSGRGGEGYVRGCVSQNAEWYQKFCKQFERSRSRRFRKPGRTIIKRTDIIQSLKKIIAGPENPRKRSWGRCNPDAWKTPNVIRLLDFMKEWTADWKLPKIQVNQEIDQPFKEF